jgi:lysophospholipase L1-like esterase
MIHRILFILVFQIIGLSLFAQQPHRFEKEVKDLVADDSLVSKKKLILFAGSSSIRMWKDLKADFPGHNVLNHGFGGSDMTDLLYYAKPLITDYTPAKVFIYEGDNDVSAGKTPEQILAEADKLLMLLRAELPGRVKIIFISAKPSVARWHLKDKYEAFNRQLEQWTKTKKNVLYADVWTPMLDENGEVRKDLFIGDNLHMNRAGYDIWKIVIGRFLK